MRRGIPWWAVASALLVLFCLYDIWPTPWRYWQLQRPHQRYFFRTNRFTGQVQAVDIGLFAEAPISVTEAGLERDRQIKPLTEQEVREMRKRW